MVETRNLTKITSHVFKQLNEDVEEMLYNVKQTFPEESETGVEEQLLKAVVNGNLDRHEFDRKVKKDDRSRMIRYIIATWLLYWTVLTCNLT
uniref:Uncharacterized protein n=1 Tax=Acrobeloides nanus TaxID=290746 RepID=A0A914DDR2_9BILA